jgi:hypothetical protein
MGGVPSPSPSTTTSTSTSTSRQRACVPGGTRRDVEVSGQALAWLFSTGSPKLREGQVKRD